MRARPLAVLALAASLLVPAVAGARPALRVSGGRLVDSRGRTVILHGVNVVYKRSPYLPTVGGPEKTSFDLQDVGRLRAWGFNTIRLGVSWRALMPRPGVVDRAYESRLLSASSLAERAGLYVLLDMHQDLYAERFGGNGAPDWAIKDDGVPFVSMGGFPLDYGTAAVGRAFENFWRDRDGIRTRFVAAWVSLARAARGHSRVLGYDLFNEPICNLATGTPPCGLPAAPPAAERDLKPFYDQVIPAVRRADPTHPVYYEDWVFTDFGWPFTLGLPPNSPWPFPNQGLSHHVYCGQPVRADKACPDQESEAFTRGVAAARHNRAAPLVTEFGATDDLTVLRRVADDADRAAEGWQYWQYKTYDDPTTSASGGAGGKDAESIVAEDGRVKASKLRILARAYPERIAGTGAAWSFSPETSLFTLSYRPRPGADTLVSLPVSVHYPHGYRVVVSGARALTGGRVVSRARSALLAIRARRGARVVAVSVRPR